MQKIKVGDTVVVRTGRDKGKQGKVVARHDESYVVVEGVNVVKKHTKPNPMKGVTGGVVEKRMPIHQSNVGVLNPATGKAERVRIHKLEGGDRVRVFSSDGSQLKA